ncbi:conserved hypothetical protein [Alteromonas sp. 38]|nr:conserved hypothetical protein [Alteromonas sp. 154]VXB96978.1 conserved hypothetical protein [Alteromonas sp. 38]
MTKTRIALIGGGPSALSILKKVLRFFDKQLDDAESVNGRAPPRLTFDIFERNTALGKGMPYSKDGASWEHITNISSDELAPFDETLLEWLRQQSSEHLAEYQIVKTKLHEKHVVPRLLFGEYLQAQFCELIGKCRSAGIHVNVHLQCNILDIKPSTADESSLERNNSPERVGSLERNNSHERQNSPELTNTDSHTGTNILTDSGWVTGFDNVVICTGHIWPKTHEGKVKGYFDSPYPPTKLQQKYNHTIALKGSSLTAIDAIRTLSEANGEFYQSDNQLKYRLFDDVPDFKIIMHSLAGLLPNIRFHLDDPLVSDEGMLSEQEIAQHRADNDGFLSLDFIFERNFKATLKKRAPHFHQKIEDMNVEAFCQWMLESRKAYEPFTLFKIEYLQAEQSIKQTHTLEWKEALALLSFTMNHPAKYFSAEDTLRLRNHLLPLIGLMIANIPQSSASQLLALHDSGVLDIVAVDSSSHLEIEGDGDGDFQFHFKDEDNKPAENTYKTFIDCTGQKSLPIDEFPFKSMFADAEPLVAKVRFKDKHQGKKHLADNPNSVCKGSDNEYYLETGGFAINDDFQPLLANGSVDERYFIMAVPYISGFNPDYSGFDFCDQVAELVVNKLK